MIWYDNLFILLSPKGYFYNEMNIIAFKVNWIKFMFPLVIIKVLIPKKINE